MRLSLLSLLVVASPACATDAPAAPKKPNIVLIMADDYGFECVGCNGGPYKTPNLDKLAAGGVRFTRAYSTPLCTPSRVQIMTGRYNFRNYVRFGEFDFQERTFAHVLKSAGYATCIAGKWQLGEGMKLPHDAGFDDYCLWHFGEGVKGSRYADPKLYRNGELMKGLEKRYGEDVFCEHLSAFASANKDRPFFLYWPMTLTHAPYEPTPDSDDPGKPRPKGKAARRAGAGTYFPDMVEYADKVVGRLVAHLEKEGLRDNTLILFTGDNGTGRDIRHTLNGREVQGGKGLTTTFGTHAPLIASWPAAAAKGNVCADLVDFTDVLPTLAAAAGAELPKGVTIDGRSFLPQIQGEKGIPRDWVFCHYEPRHGKNNRKVRYAQDARFKLYQDGKLYDTEKDPLEQKPLKDDPLPARAKLQAVLDRFEKEAPFDK